VTSRRPLRWPACTGYRRNNAAADAAGLR